MSDKVFVICPECMLELPLRRTVGDGIGVVTVLGNILNEESAREVLGTIEVLRLETRVNELHFVFEPGCKVTGQARAGESTAAFSIESASKRNQELIAQYGSDALDMYFWQVGGRNEDGTLGLKPVGVVG